MNQIDDFQQNNFPFFITEKISDFLGLCFITLIRQVYDTYAYFIKNFGSHCIQCMSILLYPSYRSQTEVFCKVFDSDFV